MILHYAPCLEDWNNIEVLQRNSMDTRPFYCGFSSEAAAGTLDRYQSGNVTLLNGSWQFCYGETPLHIPAKFYEPSFDSSSWGRMPVPGHWQLNGHDYPIYNDAYALFPITDRPSIQIDNPTGGYRHSFQLNKEAGKEYILRFDGVESAYHVWVNGQLAGYSQGPRLTAEYNITDLVQEGENLLAVKVYKFCDGSYLENQDMWWFAGIIRDVSLITRTDIHLCDYRLNATLIHDYTDGQLEGSVSIENNQATARALSLQYTVLKGESILFTHSAPVQALPGITTLPISAELPRIHPWSAESPSLYTVLITLQDENGNTLEAYPQRVGFRSVEQHDGLIWVNGSAIKFKGVNRHDWNRYTGRCITRADMVADLQLMKQNNINSVRTAHYPSHPDFLDLCDEMGFYVMEEADLECNQMAYVKGKMDKLSNDPIWEASYVDRALRMVKRDKNHPAILFWSLGNESGFGSNFVASARAVKAYDPTRPIHYEEDRDAVAADMYSSMYTRHWQLELWGRDVSKPKPHIMCEYAHAMGNGPGGLKEYWEIFRKYPRLQGGFVWEWVDHGLAKTDPNGKEYYTYGGDYDDHPNSGAFCCDGMIQADRTPTPALAQLKKALEPVAVTGFDPIRGVATIENRYDFITLDHLTCLLTIASDQGILWEKELGIEGIAPQTGKEETLYSPDELKLPSNGREYILTFTFRYREEVAWSAQKPVVAFHQELLPHVAAQLAPVVSSGKLTVTQSDTALILTGSDFTITFDTAHGVLDGYSRDGHTLIEKGLGLNLWRAPVDNDKNMRVMWEKFMVNHLCTLPEKMTVECTDDCVTVTCRHTYAPIILEWKILLDTIYTITADGTITMEVNGIPVGTLPDCLPRVGLRFVLDSGCDTVTWYGRGPGESYPDCKEGYPVGVYTLPVNDCYFPYVVPQENGNREDTRWLAISRRDGATLCVAAEDTLSFSALHYSQEQLTKARHTNELTPDEEVYLCLDYQQNGLGSASWGAETLEKDQLLPKPFHFKWQFFSIAGENLASKIESHRLRLTE